MSDTVAMLDALETVAAKLEARANARYAIEKLAGQAVVLMESREGEINPQQLTQTLLEENGLLREIIRESIPFIYST